MAGPTEPLPDPHSSPLDPSAGPEPGTVDAERGELRTEPGTDELDRLAEAAGLTPGRRDERTRSLRRLASADALDLVIVAVLVLFVFLQLGPRDVFTNSTAAGGDMGAHVWAPAYLRDHLLPDLRLAGWANDWYNGFPAYQFYMVLPALFIVIVNAGVHGLAAVVPAVAAVGIALAGRRFGGPGSALRRWTIATAVVVAVVGIGVPYGIAFKVVTVSGLLGIPIASYLLGRLADLPRPVPPMLAAGSLLFLFNVEPVPSTGNIIGGNVTSTLAGEYSFSVALAFAIAYLGVLIAGLRTGRYRAVAAVLIAVAMLCHLIVGIFTLIATLTAFVVWPGRRRFGWLAAALPVGGLLTGFWTMPFVLRHHWVNDMGWEKSPTNLPKFSYWEVFTNRVGDPEMAATLNQVRHEIIHTYLFPGGLEVVAVLAVVGLVVSAVLRVRFGLWLALTAFVLALAFVVAPEDRLWNARLLPFYYLCLALLALLGVALLARVVATLAVRDPRAPSLGLTSAVAVVAAAAVIIVVAMPLRSLPGTTINADGSATWFGMRTTANHSARHWARWNYSGYEGKAAYGEYKALVDTMATIGERDGCGRAMWEYGDGLDSYGTPMALMLLPFWTDGCIGSQEGLFFESSMTTPFHFLMQRELSEKCSCAQRNLPYGTELDMDTGVGHLQMMGVRYYMASSEAAVAAADAHPDLRPLAVSSRWHIYEVADAPLVEALDFQPAVVTERTDGLTWVYGRSNAHSPPAMYPRAEGPGVKWFMDPTQWDVPLAADGPEGWQRVLDGEEPRRVPTGGARVSDVEVGDHGLSFTVDRVGVPIVVKNSYFPNWKLSGAEGPYRIAPNLMVVIPTDQHVSMDYGRTTLDWLGIAATVLGLGLLVVVVRRAPVGAMPAVPRSVDERLVGFLQPEGADRGDDAGGADDGGGSGGADALVGASASARWTEAEAFGPPEASGPGADVDHGGHGGHGEDRPAPLVPVTDERAGGTVERAPEAVADDLAANVTPPETSQIPAITDISPESDVPSVTEGAGSTTEHGTLGPWNTDLPTRPDQEPPTT